MILRGGEPFLEKTLDPVSRKRISFSAILTLLIVIIKKVGLVQEASLKPGLAEVHTLVFLFMK